MKVEKEGFERASQENPEVVVRLLRQGDLDEIARIDASGARKERKRYLSGRIAQALSKEKIAISLVAEVKGKLIGFVIGDVLYGEYGVPHQRATIDTIGIDPQYRRRGIGALLLEEFASHARAIGVERLFTMVEEEEEELLAFFRAMGFHPASMVPLEMPLERGG